MTPFFPRGPCFEQAENVWTVVLVLGADALFWRMGPEMVLLTVFFGGAGAYITFEALGHLPTERR